MTSYIQTIFDSYLNAVYPDARPNGQGLGPTQYKELKNAFFAAYASALHEISVVPGTLPEDQAVKLLEQMQQECHDYNGEILAKWYHSN